MWHEKETCNILVSSRVYCSRERVRRVVKYTNHIRTTTQRVTQYQAKTIFGMRRRAVGVNRPLIAAKQRFTSKPLEYLLGKLLAYPVTHIDLFAFKFTHDLI